ncbi:protein kinase domain-containing protein [Corynebacterium auriscanis]|uniref:serine/threonine-protein kinase n=1 Tax=Corynebacterium auriscanis TaxID=99807 RepID=UPI003CF29F8C
MTDPHNQRNSGSGNSPGFENSADVEHNLQPDRTDFERVQRLLGSRYELNWIIGRGGMSTVWLARDTEHQRDVAVKILKPEYTENEEFRTRFRNEASAAEQLNSPNVVATYDYGEVRDHGAVFCYIIMEYVSGESLADVLNRERTLPEPLVLDIMAQTARGLQVIHATGMVHRDIKPGNLLITSDGVVKVTDLGIAKAAAAVPLTRTGMVVGTAQYVSPEQAQGNPVGPASDIYSLGVVGYEILAGERPFQGESTVSVAIKHISEDPRPLPDTVGQNMRELIGICLRKNPDARYADGEELAAATVLVAEGQRPPQPHRVPAVEDYADHPLTEQLGAVAHGPGTRVPPVQGPSMAATGAAASSRRHPGPSHPRPPQGRVTATPAEPQRPAQKKSTSAPLVIMGLLAALAVGVAGYLLLGDGNDKAPGTQTRTITSRVTPPGSSTDDPTPNNPLPGLPNGDDEGSGGEDNGWSSDNRGNRGNGDRESPTDTSTPRDGNQDSRPSDRPEGYQPAPQPGGTSQPGQGNSGTNPGNTNGGPGQGNGNDDAPGNVPGNANPNAGGNTQANGNGNTGENSTNSTGGGTTSTAEGLTGNRVQPTATVAGAHGFYGQHDAFAPIVVAGVNNVNNVGDATRFSYQRQLI